MRPASRSPADAFGLLALCFFLSGFAALIYQTAWTRQFGFVFGTSELAVATVLAAYMAGLATGAAVAGRVAPRLRRPVWAYGCVELGIALAALAVPLGLRASNLLYVWLFASPGAPPGEGGLVKALFYLACSFAILIVPTGLMGATLPLLARHAVRQPREIGSHVGILYAANTVGAVAGTVVTGFLLLPHLGLQRTIGVAILANALVFAAAAVLSRRARPVPVVGAAAAVGRPWERPTWVLPLVLVAGAVSFTYEVLWARLLGHLLGGSVYAFSTMLGTFLAGIALGAAVAARLATEPERAARGLAWAQLGTAAFSLAAFALVDRVPDALSRLGGGGTLTWAGSASVAAATLLPSTLCIGATFPFAARILIRRPEEAGAGSARVFAWNTAGAVLGAVGAGFFLVPALRYDGAVALAAALNLLVAGLAPHLVTGARTRLTAAATAGLLLLAFLRPDPPWNLLRSSYLEPAPARGNVLHFGVGRSATVLLLLGPRGFHLRTNGLQEGDIVRRGRWRNWSGAVRWLCAAPSLARPETRSMLVIGLGAGSHLESAPATLASIDVVEIEPEVVAANRAVSQERREDPLADPRVRVIANDARGALQLTGRRYDAIVSQPSHPWTAGASHLYTREFFELVRGHLRDDGVFVQWMGSSHVDEALLRGLAATLLSVFPHVRVYQPDREDLLFLASAAPFELDATAPRAIAAAPDDYGAIGIYAREDLAAVLRLDEASIREVARGGRINTDDDNRLQTRSPRIAGSPESLGRGRAEAFFAPYDPLARAGVDRAYATRRLLARGFRTRAQRLAEAAREPATRALLRGWIAEYDGRRAEAAAHFERVLELDPRSRGARLAALRLRRGDRGADDPGAERLAAGLTGLDARIVEGWRLQEREDWGALRALEDPLAAAAPTDVAFPDATRLRIAWRLADGDPERAREARALADALLPVTPALTDLVLRSRASTGVGDPLAALETLIDVWAVIARDGRQPHAARDALAALEAMPPDERTRRLHARLTAAFRRVLESEPG